MQQKIKKIIRAEFKRTNLKAFLFFLIFSALIWLLVQFSKHYTEVVEVPVTFINIPKDKLIEKKSDVLIIQTQQSGFQLAWFALFKPKISIDLSTLPAKNGQLNYVIHNHRKTLEEKLPLDFSHLKFLDSELHIPYQDKKVKKVPLISQIHVQYAPGYSSLKGVELQPDSIKVSGPKAILDTLKWIRTAKMRKENVKDTTTGTVKLIQPDSKIGLFQTRINYLIGVQKFTEREIHVPITIINAPANATVSLYPATVTVTFNISLEKYEQIQQTDFKVVCNYKDLDKNQTFLIPKLQKKPSLAKNVRLSPHKIQFVVKR